MGRVSIIAILGNVGSGKSSVAKEVAHRLGGDYISAGDIARAMTEKRSIQDFISTGEFAPEDEMRKQFEIALRRCRKSVIVLDGMPRKPEQVAYLEKLVGMVIYYVIDVDIATIRCRLFKRGRLDDTPEVIHHRIDTGTKYLSGLMSVVGCGAVVVNGNRLINEIVDEICANWEQNGGIKQ